MRNRTSLGRLMQKMEYKKLSKEYPDMKIIGLENLLMAKLDYEKTTILSSHTNRRDIAVIDRVFQERLNEIAVFIMRDSLQLRIFKEYHLPIDITQRLFIEEGACAIAIDQNDQKSIPKIMPELKSIYEEGNTVVLFPGATRKYGPVNGLSEKTTMMYILQLKRNRLTENHGIIPCGINYDPENQYISFGEPLSVTEYKPKDLVYEIIKGILQNTGAKPENIAHILENLEPVNTVLDHIKNRTPETEGIKTIDPRVLYPKNLVRIALNHLM